MKSSHQEAGFSLIELCIVLIVISLMIVPTAQLIRTYFINLRAAENKQAVDNGSSALMKYALKYGVYPYPADPSAVIRTNTFGRVAVKPGAGWPDCQDGATPQNAVCRTVTNVFGGRAVLIGTLPFAEIGMPIDVALDQNRNQLTYAVTEDLTASATFNEANGAIEIIRSDNKSVFYVDSNGDSVDDNTVPRAQFAVMTHGPDANGAIGQGGTLTRACATNLNSIDFENCNRDGKFRSNIDPTSKKVLENEALGANHFDDVLFGPNATSVGMWSNTPVAAASLLGVRDRLGGNTAIGDCAGRSPCVPVSQLDVYGAVRATGAVKAARFIGRGPDSVSSSWYAPDDYSKVYNGNGHEHRCTPEGACPAAPANSWTPTNIPPYLTPQMIGGVPPDLSETSAYWIENGGSHGSFIRGNGIRCAGGRGLNGVFDNDEACNNTSWTTPATSTQTGTCPTGEYARGINADGSVRCQTPAANP